MLKTNGGEQKKGVGVKGKWKRVVGIQRETINCKNIESNRTEPKCYIIVTNNSKARGHDKVVAFKVLYKSGLDSMEVFSIIGNRHSNRG